MSGSHLAVAEAVESRRLLSSSLSGGVLSIVGTAGNDTVALTVSGSLIKVTEGATNKTYTASAVTKIVADLKAGHDKLTLDGTISKPSSLVGGTGNDTMVGGAGKDSLRGGDNDDQLDGGANDDVVDGQAGNDKLRGGAGADALLGGSRSDKLDGGLGNDYLEGGSGWDTVDYLERTVPIKANFTSTPVAGNASVLTGKGGQSGEVDKYNGAEVMWGGSANDTLSFTGGLFDDDSYPVLNQIYIFGNGGDDYLSSGTAPLTDNIDLVWLDGGVGNDYFFTSTGPKVRVLGYTGNDTLDIGDEDSGDPIVMDLGEGIDKLTEHADGIGAFVRTLPPTIERYIATFTEYASVTIVGNALGNLIGVNSDSTLSKGVVIKGMGGNDELYGTNLNDSINGGAGNDRVYARGGNDIVFGAEGNDTLYGDAGNDSLYGETGNDKLYGGEGSDKLYAKDTAADIVDGGIGLIDYASYDILDSVTGVELK